MKKALVILLIALMSISTVFAQGASEGTAAADAGAKHKIGVLAPAVTHGWVAGVAYYAEQRCQELGDEIEYRFYTSNSAEEMTSQLDDLMLWGAEAIVCYPQWTGMEVPIQNAINAGIPVVNFDIQINAEGVYHVAGDNKDMGIQSANYIVDKIGSEGTVVILDVPSSGSVAALRKEGFLETVAEIAPEFELLTYATQFTREDGLADMADILTANPHIDAVFSMDDETSIGAIQAIQEAGRTDVKVITGGGGAQEYFNMMDDYEDLWVQSALYSPSMVTQAVDMAVALANGESVEHEVIIPTTIVDKTNVAEYLDPTSPY